MSRYIFKNQPIGIYISLMLISVIFSYSAFASNYYVTTGGNDSNNGSLSHPWKTIAKANMTLQPGDTVFIRQGTYNEDINPVRSGLSGQPIVFTGYPNEEATIRGYGNNPSEEAVVAFGYPGSLVGWGSASYIVVDGLTIKPNDARYGVAIYGGESESLVIRNCTILNENPGNPDEQAMLIGHAKHTLVENNYIDGDWDIGIITTGFHKYTIIRGNQIYHPVGSCIDIQTSYGENQAFLIENNKLGHSRIEDGIQFEPDYSLPFDDGTWRGVVIRNNQIFDNAENAIDLKGAANVVIEGNIMWGNTGDNNGENNISGGVGGVMKGDSDHTQAYDIIIRRNRIYDNLGGIFVTNYGWIIVHNTIIGNNRSYAGPDISAAAIESDPCDDARRAPKLAGVILNEYNFENLQGCVVKNNIIGGNHQGEISLITSSDLSETEIDGNMYFNSDGVQEVDFNRLWDWEKVNFSTYLNHLQDISGPIGKESHSFEVSEPGLNIDNDAPVGEGPYDFTLQPGSPAIDAGLYLTKTVNSGSGNQLQVEYAKYFFDGYEIVDGDEIQIASNGQTAKIINCNYETNVLTLDRSISWINQDGVSLSYVGSAPDIGAHEFTQVSSLPINIDIDASSTSGPAPLGIQFSGYVDGGQPPYNYHWDFGDNSQSFEKDPFHLYNTSGIFNVIFQVSDQNGVIKSQQISIEVIEELDVNIIASNTSGEAPLTVEFSSVVSGGEEPYKYTWEFGDGTSSDEPNPAHTYITPQNFTATLNLKDQENRTTSESIEIQVYNTTQSITLSPTAMVIANMNPTQCGPLSITLKTSKTVVSVPSPLIFTESDQTITYIEMSGSIPGDEFTGTLIINENVASGEGNFSLPINALIDQDGRKNNEILSGTVLNVQEDCAPPSTPSGLNISLGIQ